MASSTRRSSGPVLHSLSNSAKFVSTPTPSLSSRSPAFASSTSTFSVRTSSDFMHRSSSPTIVSMSSPTPSGSSVRFPLERSLSPKRSFVLNRNSGVQKPGNRTVPAPRKNCLCSPTTHPGSFRCSLHKNSAIKSGGHGIGGSSPSNSNRLNMRRSAMTNSLVRIGTVEGEIVKRALAALIRPSSHQQRRREEFRPRPSRLSVMSSLQSS